MIYFAIVFVVATVLFVVMRLGLRHQRLSLQQFFILYFLALVGLSLIYLGIAGRLHWLFVLAGSILPFAAGVIRWALRLWQTRGVFKTLQDLIKRAAGVSNGTTKQERYGGRGMSVEEALDILGLEANPTEKQIKTAHKQTIQKLHPDRGGSTVLAAQVNEAKEVLLKHV